MKTLALAALAALAAFAPGGAFAGVDLLPHRAAYRLTLQDGEGRSRLSDVRGGIVMELRDSCEGWISRQQLAFVADLDEGGQVSYDVRFSGWEADDRRAMRFLTRSFDDGKEGTTYQGQASLGGEEEGSGGNGAGEAVFSKPDRLTVALPADTIFPNEHMRRLIEHARAGAFVFSSKVFDGTGPDALNTITAVIGRSEAAAGTEPAYGATTWPVSLAYYAADGGDDLPSFEISFDMTDRGVLSNLKLNYGDFTLKGTLEKVEPFEKAANCG